MILFDMTLKRYFIMFNYFSSLFSDSRRKSLCHFEGKTFFEGRLGWGWLIGFGHKCELFFIDLLIFGLEIWGEDRCIHSFGWYFVFVIYHRLVMQRHFNNINYLFIFPAFLSNLYRPSAEKHILSNTLTHWFI